jgi:hypothetical protein
VCWATTLPYLKNVVGKYFDSKSQMIIRRRIAWTPALERVIIFAEFASYAIAACALIYGRKWRSGKVHGSPFSVGLN